jgi:N-acetylglutamate synthase-like GNAT family acetyltransferase
MFQEDEEDLPLSELSPLMQAIVPKLAACSLREYVPEDLEACMEVYRSNEPDFLSPQGLQNYIDFLKTGTSYYLVIEHSGDVIACGGLELVGDSDNAWLVHGMVHREYHRRGFGTTLLAARIALLETDERPIELWTRAGTSVIPFFGRMGFRLERLDLDLHSVRRAPPALCLQVEPQDILDVRDALEERSIRIHLNEVQDEDDEEQEES